MILKCKNSDSNANKNYFFIFAMVLKSLDSSQKKNYLKMSSKLSAKTVMMFAERWHLILIFKWLKP
jgi:hypothetical protein